MNINNIEKALLIKKRLDSNRDALANLESFLKAYPNGDSDGKSSIVDKKLYSLYIGEFRDGSGSQINLTGSLVQTDLLETTRQLLESRIASDLEEIEAL